MPTILAEKPKLFSLNFGAEMPRAGIALKPTQWKISESQTKLNVLLGSKF
jgi:hypothetical protein